MLVYWGIMVFYSLGHESSLNTALKNIPKYFQWIYWPYLCCDFVLHAIHDTWMYSVVSSVCVCLQTNLLTATATHSATFMLFTLYIFVQSVYHPINALCDTPFMTYINSNFFQHHGTTFRHLVEQWYISQHIKMFCLSSKEWLIS